MDIAADRDWRLDFDQRRFGFEHFGHSIGEEMIRLNFSAFSLVAAALDFTSRRDKRYKNVKLSNVKNRPLSTKARTQSEVGSNVRLVRIFHAVCHRIAG